MALISNCCGAKVAYVHNDEALCSDCREWCEVVDEDEQVDD